MENMTIQNRLAKLRDAMAQAGIQYYMIPTADFHNSEYVSDYFKVREYFCGFTGSNGTLLVWQDGAGLWTDGRYFVQAENELEGTGVTLYKMGTEGTPTIKEFLVKNMKENETLGFDGRVVSAGTGLDLEKALADKNIKFAYDRDLAGGLWEDRPALPCGPVIIIPDELAGVSYQDKLKQVREGMEKEGAKELLLSKLDDLMWLFNIRGCDVECNPVALSYGYITMDEVVLFIQEKALDDKVKAYFAENQITVKEYDQIVSYLGNMEEHKKLLAEKGNSYVLYKTVYDRQDIVDGKNPIGQLKGVKNPVELKNMEEVYLKDSAAVTRFIYWLKKNIGKMEITELSAAEHLDNLRREIPGFLDLSFPTIPAYKANAAMMHYQATPESYAVLEPDGMFLVDSGGQYMGGTTDITRTIVLGPISDEIKMHYTLSAAGMLQLSRAKWLKGCAGRDLDILARQPLWHIDVDYRCGTGHGIGYILNVHEGPHGIRYAANAVPFEEGMVVSNEPGVYVAGSHGIRIENIMVAKNDTKNEYGQFMRFDTLTYTPIDLDAIDVKYLSDVQRTYLNEYHQAVYEKISPLLPEEEKEWLKEATRAI